MELSKRILNLSESQTISMAKAARELAAKGVDVINLSFGEPDFPTPAYIKDAAKVALEQDYTFYTPVPGYLDLRQAIVDKFKRENNLEYTLDQIVVSTGAKQSLANVILSLIDSGDEVIVPTPYWVSYSEMIKLAEGKSVFVSTEIENDFKITPQELEKSISSKTKLFIFSSPCNPTGSVYSKEELNALASVFEKYPNVWILSDEIYEHINFIGEHNSIAQIPSMKDRTIIVNGLSKAFAMTGWRIGYMAANKMLASACEKMQGQITSGTNSIAQRAAITALKTDISATIAMRDTFKRRRDIVYKMLNEIPGFITNLPKGAFYFFPDISSYFGKTIKGRLIKNADDFCMYLLEEAHVAIVTGLAFGAPNYVRFSYAASEEKLKLAMERIKKALEN